MAKLDALRAAYPDAEEWMLEGVCASLDALSVRGVGGATDGATGGEVRDTIASFLGDSDAVDALSAMWALGPSALASSSAASATTDARMKEAPAGTTVSASAPARAARAPARETKSVRFVERKASNQSNASSSAERRPAPGDALAPGDLAKACVNCLRCGKVYDLRAKDGVISQTALGFLEGSARCTSCGAFVAVILADGSRFVGGSAEGDASTFAATLEDASSRDVFDKLRAISLGVQDDGEGDTTARSVRRGKEVVVDDATAAAVAAKDRLVHFDQTSAKRTTVIDDQSEYYEIDGNAWLDEHEREELKKQVQEMRDAEEEAKRRARTTWTLDLIGRRVAAPAPEDASTSTDERADDAALAAAKAIRAALATNQELAQGGGGAAASAANTASELERSRIVVNPSADRAPTFLRAAAHVKPELTRTDIPEALMQRVDQLEHARRVLDDDPFERVALEAAELGFT